MQRPLEIRFRQMDPLPAIEARIRAKAAELERFSERITGCRVIVEKEHRHHHKGNLFRVRVEVDAPGKELAGRGITRTRMSTWPSGTPFAPRRACSRTMSASVAAK